MSLARDFYALSRGQARNLGRLLRGRPVCPVSFVAMTLDRDDVELAESWLAERSRWDDEGQVAEFERSFALWNGCRNAFAFASGREALSACLAALAIGPGDEVIVPAYTCVVVRNAVTFAGARVVWADIELDTFGLDVQEVERKIGGRTRALILQHTYGLVCRDYAALLELARAKGLRVIEDCAHSTGAELEGLKVGLRGDLAFYSSEHSKAFTTTKGGLAIANDPALVEPLAAAARALPRLEPERTEACLRALVADYLEHKAPERWWRAELERVRRSPLVESLTADEKREQRPASYGRRMSAPLASIGQNQLRKLSAYNARRREAAARWDLWCDRRGYRRASVVAGSTPIFLRYPVLVEPERKRDLSWGYQELGTKPGVWFVSHLHPVPAELPGVPRAAEAVARCINLPCLPGEP